MALLSTQQYLTKILEQVHKQLLINKEIQQDQKNAQILEDFFNLSFNKNIPDTPFLGLALEKRKESLRQFGIQIQDVDTTNINFETNIMNLIMQSLKLAGIDKNNIVTITGTAQGGMGIEITNEFHNLINNLFKEYRNPVSQALKEPEKYKFHSIVTGKIDAGVIVKNTQTIEIQDTYLKQVIPLLQNCLFSAKGYENISDIRLGDTNPVRVFLTLSQFSEINTLAGIINQWHAMISCMDNAQHSAHKAARLFYELRWCYELTGIGMNYKLEQGIETALKGANYLIIAQANKPIKVYASSYLANQLKIKLQQGTLIKFNTIDKEKALFAVLKLRWVKNQFELA